MALVGLAGEGVLDALSSRQQISLTLDAFAAQPPRSSWVRITDCELAYLEVAQRTEEGRIVELLFPVRRRGDQSSPAPVVAATRDPQVLALVDGVGDASRAEQDAFIVTMLRVVDALQVSREVEGRARRGLLYGPANRRALAAVRSPLAPGVVVLDLGGSPDMVLPAAIAGLGVGALVAGFFLFRRRRRAAGGTEAEPAAAETVRTEAVTSGTEAEPPLPAAADSTVEPTAAKPAPDLRGLMLLNLDASAGTGEIERAPALGSRDEVTRRFDDAIPGIEFDERGRASLSMPGLLITADLGTEADVATVVLHAEGTEAAGVVRTLLSATGWRAYAPRRNAFVDRELLGHP